MQQCEKEQQGKNRNETYEGQRGDSLNRVVTVPQKHEARIGNCRRLPEGGDLPKANSLSCDK